MVEFKEQLELQPPAAPQRQPGQRDCHQLAKLVAKKDREIKDLQQGLVDGSNLLDEIRQRIAQRKEALAIAKAELLEFQEEQTRSITASMKADAPSVRMLAGVFKVPEGGSA